MLRKKGWKREIGREQEGIIARIGEEELGKETTKRGEENELEPG